MKRLTYSNGLVGDLSANFSRNAATWGDDGETISANERRFTSESYSVMGALDWQDTGVTIHANANLYASGPDFKVNGSTPLLLLTNPSSGTILVYSFDGATPTLESTTLWSALPGVGGTISYIPRAARIWYGLIVVEAERINDTVFEGLTNFISQDRGDTWSRVENSATDGGGFDVPTASVYGSNTDPLSRIRNWCTSIFPVGGIDSSGNHVDDDIVFTYAEYLSAAGADIPKGGSCGIFRATLNGEGTEWVLGKNRVLESSWNDSFTSTYHYHTLGMTGNGLFVLGTGDGATRQQLMTIEIDLDEYETATPTITDDVFGAKDPDGLVKRTMPQISMFAPGRGGTLIGSNDGGQSCVLTLPNASTPSELDSLEGYLWSPGDDGGGHGGHFNIFLAYYPHKGYSLGGYQGSGDNFSARHYSEDGSNWANIYNVDFINSPAYIIDDYLVALTTGGNLTTAEITPVKSFRPLQVAIGADNYLTSTSPLVNNQSPTSPNTRDLAEWNGSAWVYASNGTPIANAPTTKPAGPVLHAYVCNTPTNSTSSNIGRLVAQTTGQTIDGGQIFGVTVAMANLGSKSCPYFSINAASGGITADRMGDRRWHVDRSPGEWFYGAGFGDPTNNTVDIARVFFNSGFTISEPNYEANVLVVVLGLYNYGEYIVPWPTDYLSTNNPNEIEEVFFAPDNSSDEWTVNLVVGRSVKSATFNSNIADGTLWTIKRDANNYITCNLDGTNREIEITPTVGGVDGTTIVLDIEEWLRDQYLPFKITDNGTDLEVTVATPKNGFQSGTSSLGSIGGRPESIVFSDIDETTVYNQNIVHVSYNEEYEDESTREASLSSLDFWQSSGEGISSMQLGISVSIGF